MSFLSQPVTFFATSKRYIDDIELQVVVSENTNNTLTITKQPVQQGASISDHAYMEPTVLAMSIYFRDNPLESLSQIYQNFQDLQASRETFSVVTPKRTYDNMLIAVLSIQTDKLTENCLKIDITMQEVIIVDVTTAIVPKSRQRNADKTASTQNAGKKSVIKSGVDFVTGKN